MVDIARIKNGMSDVKTEHQIRNVDIVIVYLIRLFVKTKIVAV